MSDQVLLEAAEIIEQRGWIQGSYFNVEGFCIVGAITEVCYRHDRNNHDGMNAAMKKIRAVVGDFPTGWNDDPERTQEDVIEALRRAAEIEG